jgi:hypothetical protein
VNSIFRITYRDFPVGVIEDFITMDLYREPVIVEAVHEIIATFHGLGQLPRVGKRLGVGTSEHNHSVPDFRMQYSIDDTL